MSQKCRKKGHTAAECRSRGPYRGRGSGHKGRGGRAGRGFHNKTRDFRDGRAPPTTMDQLICHRCGGEARVQRKLMFRGTVLAPKTYDIVLTVASVDAPSTTVDLSHKSTSLTLRNKQ